MIYHAPEPGFLKKDNYLNLRGKSDKEKLLRTSFKPIKYRYVLFINQVSATANYIRYSAMLGVSIRLTTAAQTSSCL